MWTQWGEFTDCPVSCNGGTSIRVRVCVRQAGVTEGKCCLIRTIQVLKISF